MRLFLEGHGSRLVVRWSIDKASLEVIWEGLEDWRLVRAEELCKLLRDWETEANSNPRPSS